MVPGQKKSFVANLLGISNAKICCKNGSRSCRFFSVTVLIGIRLCLYFRTSDRKGKGNMQIFWPKSLVSKRSSQRTEVLESTVFLSLFIICLSLDCLWGRGSPRRLSVEETKIVYEEEHADASITFVTFSSVKKKIKIIPSTDHQHLIYNSIRTAMKK